jgi:hypothetical protein
MERKLPVELLSVLESWFSTSVTCIKWNGHVSSFFQLLSGVRQGGVLSPLFFAIFIDKIIDVVKTVDAGCYINTVCCSIFLYADDILLLSPSIHGLQLLLNACEKYLVGIDMCINVKKSSCIRFGPRFDSKGVRPVTTFGGSVNWVNSCRYLGVFFKSGRRFRCNFDNAKSRFFRAFNALYSKVGRLASEEVVLNLIRTKCLPVLFYATEACPLLSRNIHSFEFTVNRLFMKLFRTASIAIVKSCQIAFQFLPVNSQLDIRTARFLQRFIASENSLCSLFHSNAKRQLDKILAPFNGIETAVQLANALHDQFYTTL